jgi:hypothetical protein
MPKWHDFSMVRLFASMPGLNSEPQNIEYRTAELRRMESLSEAQALKPLRAGGFAQSFYKIVRIPSFDIRFFKVSFSI